MFSAHFQVRTDFSRHLLRNLELCFLQQAWNSASLQGWCEVKKSWPQISALKLLCRVGSSSSLLIFCPTCVHMQQFIFYHRKIYFKHNWLLKNWRVQVTFPGHHPRSAWWDFPCHEPSQELHSQFYLSAHCTPLLILFAAQHSPEINIVQASIEFPADDTVQKWPPVLL